MSYNKSTRPEQTTSNTQHGYFSTHLTATLDTTPLPNWLCCAVFWCSDLLTWHFSDYNNTAIGYSWRW
jgi:hypothetical protein